MTGENKKPADGQIKPDHDNKAKPDLRSDRAGEIASPGSHGGGGDTGRQPIRPEANASDKEPTQAMPKDGRKGAPDGTNRPTDHGRSPNNHDSSYPNPHTGNTDPQFEKRGGQTGMGYHGSGQLGDEEVKPGGNANAGSRSSMPKRSR